MQNELNEANPTKPVTNMSRSYFTPESKKNYDIILCIKKMKPRNRFFFIVLRLA